MLIRLAKGSQSDWLYSRYRDRHREVYYVPSGGRAIRLQVSGICMHLHVDYCGFSLYSYPPYTIYSPSLAYSRDPLLYSPTSPTRISPIIYSYLMNGSQTCLINSVPSRPAECLQSGLRRWTGQLQRRETCNLAGRLAADWPHNRLVWL